MGCLQVVHLVDLEMQAVLYQLQNGRSPVRSGRKLELGVMKLELGRKAGKMPPASLKETVAHWQHLHKGDAIMTLPIIALLVSLPILGLFFWHQTRWSKAHAYEVLARKFAPGSNEARRYRAMAEAIRQGKTIYSFAATKMPAAGQ